MNTLEKVLICALCAIFGFIGGYGLSERKHAPNTNDVRQPLTLDNCQIRYNEARLANGLKTAPLNPQAIKDAQLRADDIASGKTPLDHSGLREYQENGTFKVDYGEILAKTTGCTAAINGFLDSPTHKNGVLDPNTKYIGVGISKDIVVILSHR